VNAYFTILFLFKIIPAVDVLYDQFHYRKSREIEVKNKNFSTVLKKIDFFMMVETQKLITVSKHLKFSPNVFISTIETLGFSNYFVVENSYVIKKCVRLRKSTLTFPSNSFKGNLKPHYRKNVMSRNDNDLSSNDFQCLSLFKKQSPVSHKLFLKSFKNYKNILATFFISI
ncbi:hypothetical protein AGLY_005088, partial [Aphis glycines]